MRSHRAINAAPMVFVGIRIARERALCHVEVKPVLIN